MNDILELFALVGGSIVAGDGLSTVYIRTITTIGQRAVNGNRDLTPEEKQEIRHKYPAFGLTRSSATIIPKTVRRVIGALTHSFPR
ncbi:MAG: hypothetical protein P4M15_05285 [Alphaproteobacteria bacterium]|nr:hypothetical protein [Alphaproteobacteria bacterium]